MTDAAAMTRDALVDRLRTVLAEPIASVKARERSSLDALLAGAGNRVVLFGAGGLGRQTLGCLRSIGVDPLAFSDNNTKTWNTSVDGVAVLSPRDAAAQFGRDALFIVTIWNPYHWYVQTREQLAALGCRCITPPSPVYWRFPDTFLPFFAQDFPHKVYEQREDVLTCAAAWSDHRSREEYLRQVLWRARGEWTFSPIDDPADSDSYFLKNVFRLEPDEVFIDCGAFDGDTLRVYLSIQPKGFRRFVALEPDPATFGKLRDYVQSLSPAVGRNVETIQCAVGRERGRISFDSTGGLGSKVSSTGASAVDLVPISDLVERSAPVTFIKMDIEGAEMDALEGARAVIERDRPILAVCVYHLQNDVWRLPLFMKAMVPDYEMFLRCHEGDGWQTVAYAVPPSRRIGA
ncbi:MAG TPA: FkbM family methyltransferase [Vicinamibacterales bacterium]